MKQMDVEPFVLTYSYDSAEVAFSCDVNSIIQAFHTHSEQARYVCLSTIKDSMVRIYLAYGSIPDRTFGI